MILESDGFADLLERAEFMQRVSQQDARIIDRVRTAKAEAVATERRLDRLEDRQREVTAVVARRHEEVVDVKEQLVSRRVELRRRARDEARARSSRPASDRHELEDDLAALEREQAKIAARLAGAGTPARPARSARARAASSGRVNGTFTSPFGVRWGRLHAGIDIAVPEGTPIRAADSGSVAIAGWTGGYGNYTCINHGGGISTCYGAPVAHRDLGRARA